MTTSMPPEEQSSQDSEQVPATADVTQPITATGAVVQEITEAVAGVAQEKESWEQKEHRLNQEGFVLLQGGDVEGFNQLRSRNNSWKPWFNRGVQFFKNLDGVNLGMAILIEVKFNQVSLKGADFSRSELGGANFWYAKLDGANFTGTELCGVDFRGAKLGNVKGLTAYQLKKTAFEGASLDLELAGQAVGMIMESVAKAAKAE